MSSQKLTDTGLYIERDSNRFFDKTPTRKHKKNLALNGRIADILRTVESDLDLSNETTLVYIRKVATEAKKNAIKLPAWRGLTDKNKAIIYHLALRSLTAKQPGHRAIPFTMNLTASVIDKARNNKAGFTSHIQECIKTNLRRKLGRSVEFFFAVEIAIKGPTGRPHIHGEIMLTDSELKTRTTQQPVRDALHMINDYSDDLQFKKRAIRFEMKRCDTGWAGYTAKHISIRRMFINGKPLAWTQDCNREARQLWDSIRTI